jgi:N4-gp56 family major capsid protein
MATIQGSPNTALQYSNANNYQGNPAGYTIKPDAYYDKLLLKMLRQMEFSYAKYAVEKSLPRNYGDTINWRRFNKLSVTKSPLVEGTTPAGQQISGSEVTAVIAQYGNVMYFTDIIDLQQLDRVRQEYTVELGFQAKETMDEIVRDTLVAEGSAYFAGGATGLEDMTDKEDDRVRVDDFRRIVLGMKRGFIGGNRKAGGKYVALISPEIMYSLFDDPKVRDYMDFGQTNGMFNDGMIVDMFGIRFEEVLNAPYYDTGSVIVHDSIVIGEEAYAITKLEGQSLRVITKGLGSAGVEDPLDQRQSIGWKMTGFSTKVLLPEAVVNYWAIATDQATANGTAVEITAPNYVYDKHLVVPVTVTFAKGTNASEITISDTTVQVATGQTLAQAIAGLSSAITFGSGYELGSYTVGGNVVEVTDRFVTANAGEQPNTIEVTSNAVTVTVNAVAE